MTHLYGNLPQLTYSLPIFPLNKGVFGWLDFLKEILILLTFKMHKKLKMCVWLFHFQVGFLKDKKPKSTFPIRGACPELFFKILLDGFKGEKKNKRKRDRKRR